MKKKIAVFVREHWICSWIIISVVYAVVIQILFSFTTNNVFLVAHWSAGDILTYASTVSLGLLALWQNRKIQDENDISQAKLEGIIERSNELSIISKIVEHEERRIRELQVTMDVFMQNCDPQALAMALMPNDKIAYLSNLTEIERRVDKHFFEISRMLSEDVEIMRDDKHPLKLAFVRIYSVTKQNNKQNPCR